MINLTELQKKCKYFTAGTLAFGFVLCLTTIAQQRNGNQQTEDITNAVLMGREAERAATATLSTAAKQDAAFLKFKIETKQLYYSGETPIIKFKLINESGNEQEVYEAAHRQFSLQGEGIFSNGDGNAEIKKFEYEGSFVAPKTQEEPKPGERFSRMAPLRRKPTKTKLKTNESTSVEIDLSKAFSTELFYPGKYKITATSLGGELEAVAEFEVYFDEEKSTPILEQKLREDGTGFYLLSQYNRIKLITVLEDMQQSSNKELRDRANHFYDSLRTMDEHKLNLNTKQNRP